MCTVTYLPLGNSNFILTSSRDIPFSRESALHPKKYLEDTIDIYYPKDGKAGGTWIGLSSKNRLICLLNGGFVYHTSRAFYKKSRGLIVKQLLKAVDVRKELEYIDLIDVEQFTLTIVDWNNDLELLEFVWDGQQKHLKKLEQLPNIWSSSTLYDDDIKQLRKDWFLNWQNTHDFSTSNILKFHKTAGIGDKHIDVLMNRGLGGTVSITSIKKENNSIGMIYEDIVTKEKSEIHL